jgi:prepilin-type processing-associated H-X9-DG protein
LQFDKMNFGINSAKRQCISGNHPGGAYVVFCDGHAHWLDEKTNPELIKAMLTIDGGETIPKEK